MRGTPGSQTRTASVRPYVDFTSLDLVGVVVEPPRTDPRDAVLPPRPAGTPQPTVTVTVTPEAADEERGLTCRRDACSSRCCCSWSRSPCSWRCSPGSRCPGRRPTCVLLAVVSLALAHGPGFGLVAGFAAGLATDLVPPADHAVGRWALVLTLVGYFAGLAQGETRRSAFVPLFVVAVSAAASVLLYAGLGALINDPHVTWRAVSEILPTAVLYAWS